jgi:adenine deaminase
MTADLRSRFPLTRLVDCAIGRIPADLVIHDRRWDRVHTGADIPHTDVAVIGGRIAYVGEDAGHMRVIGAQWKFLVPGLRPSDMGLVDVIRFQFIPVVDRN